MDKQLMESFTKMYLSKKQLEKRIYDKEELEEIWENINCKRKEFSRTINLNIEDENPIWYNFLEEMELAINYINNIEKSEVVKYINDKSFENKDEFNGTQELSEIEKDNEEDKQLEQTISFIENNKNCEVLINAAILHLYIVRTSLSLKSNLQMAENITRTYLCNNGYEIMNYCKTYDLIHNDYKRYCIAIENSTNSHGDITYFIKYYLGIIKISVKELTKSVSVKYGKKIIKELIEKSNISLEEREVKFINSMFILDSDKINIEDYKKKAKVSYETARSDLNKLVALGFFKIGKCGKKYEYYFNDIATIVENINDVSGY
ncbi:MAG: hypothetical protein ACRC68_16065 [Clostridium sp.]